MTPAKQDKQAWRPCHFVAEDSLALGTGRARDCKVAASLTFWQSRAFTNCSHYASTRQLLRSLWIC